MSTKSEQLFETFLSCNSLRFVKVKEDSTPLPDYLVLIAGLQIIFELKELAEDENFDVVKDPTHPRIKSHSRTLGDQVRRRIEGSRKQLQYGADQGIPSVLLIYNSLDRVFQSFGTEPMDFVAAMYGAPTVLLNRESMRISEMFNRKGQMMQVKKNTSFSAVGHLCDRAGKTTVVLFENVFAKLKLPYDRLPPCFEMRRIEISREPLTLP